MDGEIAELTKMLEDLSEMQDFEHGFISRGEEYWKEHPDELKEAEQKRKGYEEARDDIKESREDIRNALANRNKPKPEMMPPADVAEKIKEVQELLGKENVVGPEEIEATFDYSLESIPVIPFSREELLRAKELGQQLVLYVDKLSILGHDVDINLWYIFNNFNTKSGKNLLSKPYEMDNCIETPNLGWKLVSPGPIPLPGVFDHEQTTYITQTDLLIEYLMKEVFQTDDLTKLPNQYQEAINEFRSQEKAIRKNVQGLSGDWATATEAMDALKINHLFREKAIEIVYRLCIEYKLERPLLLNRDQSLKPAQDTWSCTRQTDGRFVAVGMGKGDNGEEYIDLHGWRPHQNRGVCFARSI